MPFTSSEAWCYTCDSAAARPRELAHFFFSTSCNSGWNWFVVAGARCWPAGTKILIWSYASLLVVQQLPASTSFQLNLIGTAAHQEYKGRSVLCYCTTYNREDTYVHVIMCIRTHLLALYICLLQQYNVEDRPLLEPSR